jgi:hypothetical protein
MVVVANPDQTETPVLGEAPQEPPIPWQLQEKPEEGIFILPGGYVDDAGILHYEVELAPITGKEEEFLARMQATACSAQIITGLLSRCVKRIGSLEQISVSLIRDLLVGDRDYLIVKLREMTFGKKVEAVLRCANSSCGKPMDVTLFLDDLQVERKAISTRFFVAEVDPYLIEFRLPTGADQEALASLIHRDETKAIRQLLARCIRRIGEQTHLDETEIARLPTSVQREIEEKMQQLAPQIEIELEMTCPECNTGFITPFDFTAFFFAEMKNNLRHLEREVHFLAWHYHWSEGEILSMTCKKRRRYVELLQEELERLRPL